MQTIRTKELAEGTNANEVATSTPKTFDYSDIVRTVAKRKVKDGKSFSDDRKGKANLFSGCCATAKSLLGMDRQAELTSDVLFNIENAIIEFWKSKAIEVVENFQLHRVARMDVAKIRYNDTGTEILEINRAGSIKGETKASDPTMVIITELGKLKERLDTMMNEPERYDHEDRQLVKNKIKCNEARYTELKAQG